MCIIQSYVLHTFFRKILFPLKTFMPQFMPCCLDVSWQMSHDPTIVPQDKQLSFEEVPDKCISH